MRATPEQSHEMLTYCLSFARTMLEDSGDFYPFGATLSPEGVVAVVGGYNGDEHPVPTEIYKLLSEAILSGAARHEQFFIFRTNRALVELVSRCTPDTHRASPYLVRADGI